MIRFQYAVLTALFLYFAAMVSGCPAQVFPSSSSFGSGKADKVHLLFQDRPGPSQKKAGARPTNGKMVWKAGLLERVQRQSSAKELFLDPLLESDARPQRLVRALDRSLTGDTVLLVLCLAWCLLLILCLPALHRRHWFYRPMVLMILVPSVFALLALLLNVRQAELMNATRDGVLGRSYLLLMQAYAEVLLAMGALVVLFHQRLPLAGPGALQETGFMGHLRPVGSGSGSRWRGALQIAGQMTLIVLAGLLLSNLVLFPMYTLQMSFPRVFLAVIVLGLAALSFFYVRAYVRVTAMQHDEAHTISGMAFLGFRLIRNALFIAISVTLVLGAIAAIVVITWLNVSGLQTIELLKKPGLL